MGSSDFHQHKALSEMNSFIAAIQSPFTFKHLGLALFESTHAGIIA
jgi:hypothetical protein